MRKENKFRAEKARAALRFFSDSVGLQFEIESEIETVITDMLVDLRHLIDFEGLEFSTILDRVNGHYKAEKGK